MAATSRSRPPGVCGDTAGPVDQMKLPVVAARIALVSMRTMSSG